MLPVCHSLGHVFVVLTSVKSNDITNIFIKSILVQKIALTSIYDIIMSPEHFEIVSFITIKNRQLSTVPLNCAFNRLLQ